MRLRGATQNIIFVYSRSSFAVLSIQLARLLKVLRSASDLRLGYSVPPSPRRSRRRPRERRRRSGESARRRARPAPHRRRPRAPLHRARALPSPRTAVSVLVLILAIVLALVASVALAIDVVLVVVAREQLKKLATLHFDIAFGNGVWMIIVAVISGVVGGVGVVYAGVQLLGQRR